MSDFILLGLTGRLVTLGFGGAAAPIVVPPILGVDWELGYRPVLALAPSAVPSLNPDLAGGLTPTTGEPPGIHDWTIIGGDD